jgi:2-oxoglutarate dehydrogenase E2 component (dihydrolipoamide succinyltransferase)
MAKEIRVPQLGESVTEATIGKWFKAEGQAVKVDEPLVELETDKVTVEVPAPAAGVLSSIAAQPGQTVNVGALLGAIEEGAAGAAAPRAEAKPPAKVEEPKKAAEPQPAAAGGEAKPLSPAVRKIVEENKLDPGAIAGTGKDGRLTKGDVLAEVSKPMPPPAIQLPPVAPPQPAAPRAPSPQADAEREERVRMSRLRQTIARRLKDAQNTAAMLTTFNEVDMTHVMALRNQYKEVFEKKHGVKLGFMSFFVKAVINALKEIPAVNAEIDADRLSFAQIEKTINDFGKRARDGQLQIAEMQGGTFTISNGGVYGSLMSTPILNAPQSGILGMHKIQERPVAFGGQVVIRPMMYLALSYDHRIVDGKEAVTFLVRVKEGLEDPQRALLDL